MRVHLSLENHNEEMKRWTEDEGKEGENNKERQNLQFDFTVDPSVATLYLLFPFFLVLSVPLE